MYLVSVDEHFKNVVKVYEVVTFIWRLRVRDDSGGGGHLDFSRVSLHLCVFSWFQFNVAFICLMRGRGVRIRASGMAH